MRKFRFLLFTLLICFLFTNVVNAAKQLECEYGMGHNTYRVVYLLNGDVSQVSKIYKTNDYVTEEDVTSTYTSWFSVNIKENDTCPKVITTSSGEELKLFSSSSSTQGGIVTDSGSSSCVNYKTKPSCKNSGSTGDVACVWNETKYGNYCNVDNLMFVACGDAIDIPYQVPGLISFLVNLLKIATPIILIVISIISLLKALAASNEDEIKKAQKSLIRKIAAAVLVFFVISIVQFVIFIVADDEIQSDYNNLTEVDNLSDCLNCFLNNDCEENIYYRTNIGGDYYYYSVATGDEISLDKEYYVSTNYYKGHKNTDCQSYGYFGEDDGYSDSYHPKAVKANGTCYTLTDTGNKIKNYTNYLTGEGKIYTQSLYSAKGTCYYWEGRINNYIETSCDTEIVTAFYNGSKPTSCNKEYFNYSNTSKKGYQPKSIPIDGTCYEIEKTNFKYVNRTTNLFGDSQEITQSIWKANGKCYYWEGRQMSYVEVECKDYY